MLNEENLNMNAKRMFYHCICTPNIIEITINGMIIPCSMPVNILLK